MGNAPVRIVQPVAARGSPLLELSNAIVQLHKELMGRGPSKTRASFAGPDTVVILMENGFTVAERNLVALGQHARVRESRMLLHARVEADLKAIVERTLHRRPIACVTGVDPEHDLSVAVVTLARSPARPSAA